MTYNSDGSVASIQALHDSTNCHDGDTITVPSGTFTWATGIVITKGITLQGNTRVTGTHADGGQSPPIQANPVITPNTIVIYQPATTDVPAIILRVPAGKGARVTGIEFTHGTLTGHVGASGFIYIGKFQSAGFTSTSRIDHCHFNHVEAAAVFVQAPGNLIDNCVIDTTGAGNPWAQTIHCENGVGVGLNGDLWGDTAWTLPAGFGSGTNGATYIEDCYLHAWDTNGGGGLDCYRGGKYVARYCTFHNNAPNSHGTDSGGRVRSVRCVEIYNNVHKSDNTLHYWGEFRGGTGLLFNETYLFPGGDSSPGMGMGNYRADVPFTPFGGAFGDPARGNSEFDLNDFTDHTGNGFGGGPNGLYGSGTASTTNTQLLTVAGTPWTAHQWQGYRIVNGTTSRGSVVIDNTTNSVTYALDNNNYGEGWNCPFTAGDRYEFRKIIAAIDSPGHGAGDLVTGSTPVNSRTGTRAPLNQAQEPIYAWNNLWNGVNVPVTPKDPSVIAGRDFFNATPMQGYTPYAYPHPLTQMITLTGNTATAETITLTWTGAIGTTVDIWRDGVLFAGAVPNSGTYVTTETGGGIGVSHIWEVRGNTASNDVTLV